MFVILVLQYMIIVLFMVRQLRISAPLIHKLHIHRILAYLLCIFTISSHIQDYTQNYILLEPLVRVLILHVHFFVSNINKRNIIHVRNIRKQKGLFTVSLLFLASAYGRTSASSQLGTCERQLYMQNYRRLRNLRFVGTE